MPQGLIILDSNPDLKKLNLKPLIQSFEIAIILNEFNELSERASGANDSAIVTSEYQALSAALDETWPFLIYAYYLKNPNFKEFSQLSPLERDQLFDQIKNLINNKSLLLLELIQTLQSDNLKVYKEKNYKAITTIKDAQNAVLLLNSRLQSYFPEHNLKIKYLKNSNYILTIESE